MAIITLGNFRDYFKRVSDWVSGANTDKPKVTVDNFPATQNVQLTGSIGLNLHRYYHQVELPASAGGISWTTLLDVTYPAILEHLEWYTNNQTSGYMKITTDDGKELLYLNRLTTYNAFRPDRMAVGGFRYFNVIEYDTTNNRYRFEFAKQLSFPDGVKIELGNGSTTEQIVNSAIAYLREMQ